MDGPICCKLLFVSAFEIFEVKRAFRSNSCDEIELLEVGQETGHPGRFHYVCSGAGAEGQRSQQRGGSRGMRFRPAVVWGTGRLSEESRARWGMGSRDRWGAGGGGETMEGGASRPVPAVLGCLSPEVWATLRCLAAG